MEGGSYRGHEGVRRALVDAYETWETSVSSFKKFRLSMTGR
jgi:hypothetical protein